MLATRAQSHARGFFPKTVTLRRFFFKILTFRIFHHDVFFHNPAALGFGHTCSTINATAIPNDTSMNRCHATTHADLACGTNSTIAIAIPANRYAVSTRNNAHTSPSKNTPTANTHVADPKYVSASAPAVTPSAVPTNRCHPTLSGVPAVDCIMTNVEIGAQ